MNRHWLGTLTALAISSPAFDLAAQPAQTARSEPSQLALRVGAGLTQFTNNQVSELTSVGGAWEARLTWGRERLVGVELGYQGSVQGIDAEDFGYSATLLGNALEAALRFNPPDLGRYRPYVLIGVGLVYYRVTNESTDLPFVNDSDFITRVPVALGLEVRAGRVFFDVRGSLRPSFGDELVRLPGADGSAGPSAGADTWAVLAGAGFGF